MSEMRPANSGTGTSKMTSYDIVAYVVDPKTGEADSVLFREHGVVNRSFDGACGRSLWKWGKDPENAKVIDGWGDAQWSNLRYRCVSQTPLTA